MSDDLRQHDQHDDNEPDLSERFPNLTPISSAPTLQTMNGIGTTIYGGRDYDHETGTYVTTQFFTFLFVPIFGLASYRVATPVLEEYWALLATGQDAQATELLARAKQSGVVLPFDVK
ncbi:MAG: hypothetical protein AB7K24_01430 [Gemmataceae bacterium]